MPAPRQPIEIREFPRPDLPPQGALLRTARAEVCGTDVHLWHGRLAGVPYPIIPGHGSAGTLDAIRGPLEGIDGSTLREGAREPGHVLRALTILERHAGLVPWRDIGERVYPL